MVYKGTTSDHSYRSFDRACVDLAKRRKLRDRVSRGCRLRSKRKCHRLQPEDDDPLAPLPHFFRQYTPPVATAAATPTNSSPLSPPPPPPPPPLSVTSPFARELPPVIRDTLSLSPEGTLPISHFVDARHVRVRVHVHHRSATRVETRNVRREIACAFRNVTGANENR